MIDFLTQLQRFEDFKNEFITTYSEENPDHEATLRAFFEIAFSE